MLVSTLQLRLGARNAGFARSGPTGLGSLRWMFAREMVAPMPAQQVAIRQSTYDREQSMGTYILVKALPQVSHEKGRSLVSGSVS
jgi:hypothetical protein